MDLKKKLTPEEFDKAVAAFKELSANPVLWHEFAASRADVIVPEIEVASVISDLFEEEQLAPGADSRHDVLFDDVNMVINLPHVGATPVVQFEAKEFHVDTFQLTGGVEWSWKIAREGRFPVAEQATGRLRDKFLLQRELAAWGVIKFHAASLPTAQVLQAFDANGVQTPGSGQLNYKTITKLITKADTLGKGGRRITDIFMTPTRYGDLFDQVVYEKLPEAIRLGIWNGGTGPSGQAEMRFHKVYNQRMVADNRAYAFTQKGNLKYGVKPVRERLFTKPNRASEDEWKFGVIGREELGYGIRDTLGLVEIRF